MKKQLHLWLHTCGQYSVLYKDQKRQSIELARTKQLYEFKWRILYNDEFKWCILYNDQFICQWKCYQDWRRNTLWNKSSTSDSRTSRGRLPTYMVWLNRPLMFGTAICVSYTWRKIKYQQKFYHKKHKQEF